MSGAAEFVATFHAVCREVHGQLRAEVSGLDARALTWVPGPDTNSIATIVIHLLGSEAEVLKIVRGRSSDRDRDAEFRERINTHQDLLSRIDEADRIMESLAPGITEEDLATARVRPSAVRNRTPRTGLFWLINTYGHAREHLAHLQLTKQLFLQEHQEDYPIR